MKEMIQKSDKYRVPEMDHLADSKVYELPEHTVTVTDMSEINLSTKANLPARTKVCCTFSLF